MHSRLKAPGELPLNSVRNTLFVAEDVVLFWAFTETATYYCRSKIFSANFQDPKGEEHWILSTPRRTHEKINDPLSVPDANSSRILVSTPFAIAEPVAPSFHHPNWRPKWHGVFLKHGRPVLRNLEGNQKDPATSDAEASIEVLFRRTPSPLVGPGEDVGQHDGQLPESYLGYVAHGRCGERMGPPCASDG